MTKLRYRLGLSEPCFNIDPRVPLRALRISELDELASMLRSATAALQGLDGELGDRLDQIEHLEDPWWSELRPEMLRRGYAPQNLDDNFGSCALGDFTLRLTEKPGVRQEPPRWWASLLAEIVSHVDPEPLTVAVAEHIRVLAKVDVARLDICLEAIRLFHPFGAPRQVEITNLSELWGMRPVAETDDGSVVYGYGEDGAPKEMPWQSGAVKPRVGERPSEGPAEDFWQPGYVGLLSWIGELLIVIDDRLGAILGAREQLDHLRDEIDFLVGLEAIKPLPCYQAILALSDTLGLCRRLLSGLHTEIADPRRRLVDNLRAVLRCLGGTWREPLATELRIFEHELRLAGHSLA